MLVNSTKIVGNWYASSLTESMFFLTQPSLTFGYSNIDFSAFVGGSEIPNWFEYQGIGSSLNIEVDQEQEQLVGFAISAVFELKEAIDGNLVSIGFVLNPEGDNFNSVYGSHFTNVIDCGDEDRFVVESDHLWLGFHNVGLISPKKTIRSFRVSFHISGSPHKIKSCGINPLYESQVILSAVRFNEFLRASPMGLTNSYF